MYPQSPAEREICYYYLNFQLCKKNEKCRIKHLITEENRRGPSIENKNNGRRRGVNQNQQSDGNRHE